MGGLCLRWLRYKTEDRENWEVRLGDLDVYLLVGYLYVVNLGEGELLSIVFA